MNKFEKQLAKWNNGVLRGAQAKLAKHLGVSTATTALWATGKRHPSKGYVAQMAELFGLDVYRVLKLFEANAPVVYPFPNTTQKILRDGDDATPYLAASSTAQEDAPLQSNSVNLPFLEKVPSNSTYNEDDVIEWWALPRRYAQGAKYIVRSHDIGLEDATSPDDLCLIKPTTQALAGQVVVFMKENDCRICRVLAGQAQYQTLSGKKCQLPAGFEPLGIITKRIKPI